MATQLPATNWAQLLPIRLRRLIKASKASSGGSDQSQIPEKSTKDSTNHDDDEWGDWEYINPTTETDEQEDSAHVVEGPPQEQKTLGSEMTARDVARFQRDFAARKLEQLRQRMALGSGMTVGDVVPPHDWWSSGRWEVAGHRQQKKRPRNDEHEDSLRLQNIPSGIWMPSNSPEPSFKDRRTEKSMFCFDMDSDRGREGAGCESGDNASEDAEGESVSESVFWSLK
ncbi:hypothetical protein ACHAPT_009750 [Fusarium lateritium]